MLTNKNKRTLKRWAKKFQAEKAIKNELRIEGLLIHHADGDHDHEIHKIFIKANNKETALKNASREFPVYGLDIGPTMYDCTGQPFCEPAEIREVAPERFMINLYIRYDV
jgi:hypothetical protein